MNNDEAIIEKLGLALDHLKDGEVLMAKGVSAEAWPKVGHVLSEIMRTIKQIELDLSGFHA
mgnify:CR=1 FL=1